MNTSNQVNQLVELVLKGQILEAFDRFYAENVSMQENQNPPTIGKAANRQREIEFLGSVKELHRNVARFILVDGNRAAIGWLLEFTNHEGQRLRLNQVALQRWEDGQVVEELFVYDPTSVAVQEAVLA